MQGEYDFDEFCQVTGDHTLAWQAAIAVMAQHPGVLRLGVGTYTLRPTAKAPCMLPPSRCAVVGQGSDLTTIQLVPGSWVDLFTDQNYGKLAGSGTNAGNGHWLLSGLTLDGGCPGGPYDAFPAGMPLVSAIKTYSYGYKLLDVRVQNFSGDGVISEWGADPAPQPLGTMATIIRDCVFCQNWGSGVRYLGPHDGLFDNCEWYWNHGPYGLYLGGLAGGTRLVNSHVYGNLVPVGWQQGQSVPPAVGVQFDAPCFWWNSQAESYPTQVAVNASGCCLEGGQIYDTNDRAPGWFGLRLGTAQKPVTGVSISGVKFCRLTGGVLDFSGDGGGNKIDALVEHLLGSAIVGTPHPATVCTLYVTGGGVGSWYSQTAGPEPLTLRLVAQPNQTAQIALAQAGVPGGYELGLVNGDKLVTYSNLQGTEVDIHGGIVSARTS